MKTFIIYFLILSAFIGCGNGTNSNSKHLHLANPDTTLTEVYDNLGTIVITPHNSAILKLGGSKNSTSNKGNDTVHFYIQSDEKRTFCIKDLADKGHRVNIRNSSNELLGSLTQGCSTLNLKKGYYDIEIENADKADNISHTVFITSHIENNPLYTDMKDVSSDSLQRKTLISFNVCKNCNLSEVKLHNLAFDSTFDENNFYPNVNDEYFKVLNTTKEEFFSEQNQNENHSKQKLDISGSTLYGADLSYSIFRDATFNGVDFSDANLSHAVFIDCSFDGAIFDKVDMTKTVFISPTFGKNSIFRNRARSKVSVAQLSQVHTGKYGKIYSYDYLSSFIIDENLMGLYFQTSDNKSFLRTIPTPKAPGISAPLYFESPPSTVRLNYHLDYAVFARLSDGYIWSYKSRLKKWDRLVDSNKCKSSPSALSWSSNLIDSSSVEPKTQVLVTCHDTEGTLYSWDRYFHGDENPVAWTLHSFQIDKLKGNISVDTLGQIAYIKDNKLHINYLSNLPQRNNIAHNRNDQIFDSFDITSSKELSFNAQPVLNSYSGVVAVVMSDGNVYDGAYKGDFKNLGHPDGGINSAPNYPKKEDYDEGRGYFGRVILLNRMNEIYTYITGITRPWRPLDEINQDINNTTRNDTLQFTNNIFNFTYFEMANLAKLDFSTNNMTHVFLNFSIFNFSSFNNMDLNDTYFYESSFFQADFSGSHINGLTWYRNDMTESLFNKVSFSDKEINAINTPEQPPMEMASFKNAKNIPVELFYDSDESKVYDATILEDHDFTGASFKNLNALNFHNITLKNLHFREANLSNFDASKSTWLASADLSYAKGENINFDKTEFNGTSFYQSNISNSSFIASQWREVNASYGIFQHDDMYDINISNSDISHAAFNDSNLSMAKMHEKVNAKYASFERASLRGVKFQNIALDHANFNKADLDPMLLGFNIIQIDSNITGSNLSFATLDGTNMRCIGMNSVTLNGASLYDANLSGADLSSLLSPRLQNVNFEKVDFSGANFQNTNMGSSDLTNAIFDFKNGEVDFEGFACSYHYTPPETSSATTCVDGYKPSKKCEF